MKKIGILHGQERSFPNALVERINQKAEKGIVAEALLFDKVIQAEPNGFDVLLDRISQDVPFYRGMLKNAAITGTAVLNNPFWWSADEKFFNNALAEKIGVPVPRTVLLPSNLLPAGTTSESFSNQAYPLDWDGIFEYVGWPAYFKPFDGGGWKNVYKLTGPDDFFRAYNDTGHLVMMLQEEIVFEEYYRCYCIGGKDVLIMPYDPRNPHHLRYQATTGKSKALLDTIKKYTLALNKALGYDFNTVEFAVRNGVPIAIDFCNPAPDADVASVGAENFEWVVECAANMLIKRAKEHKTGQMNLTWGSFVTDATAGKGPANNGIAKPAAPAAKAAAKKEAGPKIAATKKITAKPAAKKAAPAKK
jgi:glutathione synthase/RimK-type ligase-like ATP-grasp enzyme